MTENMSSSKSQTRLVHSKKIENHFFKSQTATKSMIQIDQQMQIKTVLNIVTLISIHTIINIFAAFDILRVSIKRTIISSRVAVTRQIKDISVLKSRCRAAGRGARPIGKTAMLSIIYLLRKSNMRKKAEMGSQALLYSSSTSVVLTLAIRFFISQTICHIQSLSFYFV